MRRGQGREARGAGGGASAGCQRPLCMDRKRNSALENRTPSSRPVHFLIHFSWGHVVLRRFHDLMHHRSSILQNAEQSLSSLNNLKPVSQFRP